MERDNQDEKRAAIWMRSEGVAAGMSIAATGAASKGFRTLIVALSSPRLPRYMPFQIVDQDDLCQCNHLPAPPVWDSRWGVSAAADLRGACPRRSNQRRSDWGFFKRHFWGDYARHSQSALHGTFSHTDMRELPLGIAAGLRNL